MSQFDFFFVIAILIALSSNELGQFLTAKLLKIKVNELSFGFGPTIKVKRYKRTLYSLRWGLIGLFATLEDRLLIGTRWKKQVLVPLSGIIFNFFLFIVSSVLLNYLLGAPLDYAITLTNRWGVFLVQYLFGISTKSPIKVNLHSSNNLIETALVYFSAANFYIGMLNAIPFTPLNGGKIIAYTIDRFAPASSRNLWIERYKYLSVVVIYGGLPLIVLFKFFITKR